MPTKRNPGPSLAELLLPYKQEENPFGLVIVADDLVAKKLLAAFELQAPPPWRRPSSRPPDDLASRWVWLWRGIEGDRADGTAPRFLSSLARAAAVADQTAALKWPSLMTSRLVYPDGTIAQVARGLLQAFVVQHLPRPTEPGRRGRPPKKEPTDE